ncbi:lipoprotein [Spiroplasma endosymbiont of Diplazon laetatorius]|uniref:lipoprotein n=1 Tax=Spiroplasma endosymbiont of Diplazon laetatorius TaxID=3066322 RepID=UPI0030CC9CF5
MKKILSLLGATLITVSPATLLVSCATKDMKLNENSVKTLVEQIAKAAYLNENKGYDYQYEMDEILKVKRIKDISTVFENNIDEDITAYSRFGELYDKYMDKNPFVNGYELEEGLKPKSATSLETLFVTLPNLIDMLASGKLIKFLFNSVLVLPQITGVLKNHYLTGYLDNILSKENADLLSKAFSNDIYEGFTNQETINSALMGLSNSIDFMLRNTKTIEIPNKENSTGDAFLASVEKLTKNLTAINKKEKTINLDLIVDLPAIAEIIRFARTMIVYTAQGVSSLSTSTGNYFKDITTFRKNNFDVKNNKLDIIAALDLIVDTYNDGSGLRKMLSVLFQSYENPKIKTIGIGNFATPILGVLSDEIIYEEGLSPLIQALFNSIIPSIKLSDEMNKKLITTGIKDNINIGSGILELVNTIISNNSINGLFKCLNSVFVRSQLPEVAQKIVKELINTSVAKDSIWEGLYGGEFVKLILNSMGKNVEQNINIKTILEGSRVNILETELSITEIFSKIKNTSAKGNFLLDFDKLSNLISGLRSILDLNNGIKDESFKYSEFVDNLSGIVTDLAGMNKLTDWLTQPNGQNGSIIENYNQNQAKLKLDIYNDVYNLQAQSVNKLSNYAYKAVIQGKEITINFSLSKKSKLQIKSIA